MVVDAWKSLVAMFVYTFAALGCWRPFIRYGDLRQVATGPYDCVADPDHLECTAIWPFLNIPGVVCLMISAVASVFHSCKAWCLYGHRMATAYGAPPVTVDRPYQSMP